MEGVVELAEEIFHMPVSIGRPQGVTGLADIVKNPIYSTAVGLLLYGGEQQNESLVLPSSAGMVKVVGRVRNWLTGSYG